VRLAQVRGLPFTKALAKGLAFDGRNWIAQYGEIVNGPTQNGL
jgi:hypothetical protein